MWISAINGEHDYLIRCGELDNYEDLSVTEETELNENHQLNINTNN